MKEDSFKGKYYMKDSKMFKKQPSRIRQYDKDIYEETIRVKSRNKVSTNLNIKTNSVRPKLYGGKEDIGLK